MFTITRIGVQIKQNAQFERAMEFMHVEGPSIMEKALSGDLKGSEQLNVLLRQTGIAPVLFDGYIWDGEVKATVASWKRIVLLRADKKIGVIWKDPEEESPLQVGGGYGYIGE